MKQVEHRVLRNKRTGTVREDCALIEGSDPGKNLEATGTSRKPKFQFPVSMVLKEVNIRVALVC